MDSATTIERRVWIRRRGRLSLVAGSCLALMLAFGPGSAPAKKSDSGFSAGTYRGKTTQESVDIDFRAIELKVSRKGRVTLKTEPVVRRGECTSPPVFTLEGATPTKPLSGRGAFAFTHTFFGTKIDKIKGQFVSETRIEGTAVYNFEGSDLCTPGSVKVKFGANRQKK